MRKPGFVSPYPKYWYNRGVQGSVLVDLAWYCLGLHPRGSLDFWNIDSCDGVWGHSWRAQQGNFSRQQLTGHCTSEVQSVPPPHELCCCYFNFTF